MIAYYTVQRFFFWYFHFGGWNKSRTLRKTVFKAKWKLLFPAFSVMCIADIFRHPSFDMLSKQDGSRSNNHSPLAWPFELVASLTKTWHETNTGMHWLWLAHFKQHAKRWCRKINVKRCRKIATMHVTLKAGLEERKSNTLSYKYLEVDNLVK